MRAEERWQWATMLSLFASAWRTLAPTGSDRYAMVSNAVSAPDDPVIYP